MEFTDPERYGSVLAPLLRLEESMPLDVGAPREDLRKTLDALHLDTAFGHPAQDHRAAWAAFAGLWLLHGFLDESHRIAQTLATREGAWWHAMLHRREGDFENAKYWHRRAEGHPILSALAPTAAEVAEGHPGSEGEGEFLTRDHEWVPDRFVDFCAAVRGAGDAREALAREVQQREWDLLFDWCWRGARGETP